MNIRIYSWNVNGIRAVERKGFVDWLHETAPDILCIQETKAWAEQLSDDLTKPEGYHVVFDEAEKKGYSGAAIYSVAEPISTSLGIPEEISSKYKEMTDDKERDATKEGRVVTAELDDFYVVSVYTPNSKDTLERIPLRHKAWDPAFLEYMKQLEAKKPVVFCGDFNAAHTEDDLARPKENLGKRGFTDEERLGIQNYIDNGFVDTYRMYHEGSGKYTYWVQWANARQNNVGWRIDYIFVSDSLKDRVHEADIHDEVMGSDHAPISITLEV